eukprot:scaffold168958_cov27-Tisochrysis_lutea.AAC.1
MRKTLSWGAASIAPAGCSMKVACAKVLLPFREARSSWPCQRIEPMSSRGASLPPGQNPKQLEPSWRHDTDHVTGSRGVHDEFTEGLIEHLARGGVVPGDSHCMAGRASRLELVQKQKTAVGEDLMAFVKAVALHFAQA